MRINKYCEINDILVDEQNGFRKGRSCSDHLFTLTSIIRNHISQNKSTFCAFIDMEKAFDCLDRNLLYYRLLLHRLMENCTNLSGLCTVKHRLASR